MLTGFCSGRLLWVTFRATSHCGLGVVSCLFLHDVLQVLLCWVLVVFALVLFFPCSWEKILDSSLENRAFILVVYAFLVYFFNQVTKCESLFCIFYSLSYAILLYFLFIWDLSLMTPFCTSVNQPTSFWAPWFWHPAFFSIGMLSLHASSMFPCYHVTVAKAYISSLSGFPNQMCTCEYRCAFLLVLVYLGLKNIKKHGHRELYYFNFHLIIWSKNWCCTL